MAVRATSAIRRRPLRRLYDAQAFPQQQYLRNRGYAPQYAPQGYYQPRQYYQPRGYYQD